ncbi:MAG: CehA/McbA family metallohydrolase [Planctomycetota bacterium]
MGGRLRVAAGGVALCLIAWSAAACQQDEPVRAPTDRAGWVAGSDDTSPPTARTRVAGDLAADLAAERHASDGGGRLSLDLPDGDDGRTQVGASRSWAFLYEAGPLGVAVGGTLDFQPPPFWGWSPPQRGSPDFPGYTTIETQATGVTLESVGLDAGALRIGIGGRALASGETIRIVYGAGPAGARADIYAERGSPFHVFVDGDGDGVREALPDPPTVDVHAGPPARLIATLDSTARPGDEVRLCLAVLDAAGNAGCEVDGWLTLDADSGLDVPARVALEPDARGRAVVTARVTAAGVQRVRVTGPAGLSAISNPLLVHESGSRILWADLHGHSNLSDGTGLPEDYYSYARDVARLDIAALSDHDHWGLPFMDRTPDMWETVKRATREAHEPGRFVTLLAYEWTSWIHGHRHVLYFTDEGEIFSSVDPRHATPRGLWDALAGQPALTLTHHSAGEPVPTDWSWAPDPVLEPLTEIMSVHGCSEAADAPRTVRGGIPGNFARDALDQGYRLGFVGSGDSHDGHPGLVHLASGIGTGGLAAVLAEDCTREAVLEALRARRAYATSGQRIVLRVTLDGRPMGSPVPAGAERLVTEVVGTAPIQSVDLVRSGSVVETRIGDGAETFKHSWSLQGLARGEYVYVRVIQADGGMAWSSPFFAE